MIYLKIIILKIFFISFSFAKTPFEYGFSLSSGYDDNVMRLSSQEFNEASQNRDLMGGAKKFDSFRYKIGFNSKKSLWQKGKKELFARGNLNRINYQHNKNKKYWSSGFDLIYKWGSYKNIRYSLRHLNNFYLRHYVDRDISNSKISSCLFTDQNQKISITYLIQKKNWVNFGVGYLQRYYNVPFTEFDLDIYYIRGKINQKISRIGSISLQLENGFAISNYDSDSFRPSSFNRSYETLEWYLPFILKYRSKILKEIGFSIRQENRQYVAEDLNDPLHSGRNHVDNKYDIWIKKDINEIISATFTSRFRRRDTQSQYEWVTDLKSFNQIQLWFKIEWDLIYDQY